MKVYPIAPLRKAFLKKKDAFANNTDVEAFRKHFSGIDQLLEFYPNAMTVFPFKNTLAFDEATAIELHQYIEDTFNVTAALRPWEVDAHVQSLCVESSTQATQLKTLQKESQLLHSSRTKQSAAVTQQQQKALRLKSLKEELVAGVKLVCLDIEAYEFNHNRLLEIGYSVINTRKSSDIVTHQFVLEETLDLRNGKYVPDHKFDFNFGEVKVLPLWKILSELADELKGADYLVGHSIRDDVNYLKGHINFEIPTLDTQHFGAFVDAEHPQMKLSKILDSLNIEYSNLHNAGNDCRYTLEAMLGICLKYNREMVL